MSLMTDRKALILGVANERSIAWGIAKKLKSQGAAISMTYLNEALKKRVEPLAKEIGVDFLCEMDVSKEEHFVNLRNAVEEKWGMFDVLVHSLAFADREDLKNNFSQTSREGFLMAMDISAYSLIGLCKHLHQLINPEGSVIAMTYYGSRKVVKNYNVMGVAKAALETSMMYLADDLGRKKIRVNCISSGPIKTLASSGISGLRSMLEAAEEKSLLKRNITTEDVAGMALYLASDLAQNVTGQTLYVDSGLSSVGF